MFQDSDVNKTIPSIELSEIWKIGFKKVSQLRKHSPIPRQAIDNHKKEMAFWRKFVVEDRIEVVGNLILHPFIYTFHENSPTDFLGKLVIAAKPENKGISVCAPKEIIEIQIDRELAEKVDAPGETGESIEFISTGAETIDNPQLPPRCLIINL
jgi:hypothetical protein